MRLVLKFKWRPSKLKKKKLQKGLKKILGDVSAMWNCVNAATGMTPNELLLSRDLHRPAHWKRPHGEQNVQPTEKKEVAAWSHQTRYQCSSVQIQPVSAWIMFATNTWWKLREFTVGQSGIDSSLIDLEPVSYTHLDVYKRQEKYHSNVLERLTVGCTIKKY